MQISLFTCFPLFVSKGRLFKETKACCWVSLRFRTNLHSLVLVTKLQNRAARIITGSSFTTSALPLIESLGWKTIEELISNKTKICVFKALNGLAPQYLTELFSRNSQRSLHILRNTSTDLKLPLFKTANGQKCFSFRGVKYWNSLSAESKQAVTLHSFKASI